MFAGAQYLLSYTILTTNTQIHHNFLLFSRSDGLAMFVNDAIVISCIQIQDQIIVNRLCAGIHRMANGTNFTAKTFGLHQ